MENFTKTIQRIRHYIDTEKISVNKFSVKLGVSNSYFSKMFKNEASVGSDIIEKILRTYPDLNSEWLLTGKGEMLKHKNNVNEPQEEYYTEKTQDCCSKCQEKEKRIDDLQNNINNLNKTIDTLHQYIDDLRRMYITKEDKKPDGNGQKRKAS